MSPQCLPPLSQWQVLQDDGVKDHNEILCGLLFKSEHTPLVTGGCFLKGG